MCQCPQRASTHFFGFKKMNISELEDMCQCPQRASTHFFTYFNIWWHSIRKCQCPQRASTHFFKKTIVRLNRQDDRVNALNGLLLISSKVPYSIKTAQICVNALNGLLLISSVGVVLVVRNFVCVNALNGLLLISSFSRIFGKKTPISQVSMPSTGFYSFLQRMESCNG